MEVARLSLFLGLFLYRHCFGVTLYDHWGEYASCGQTYIQPHVPDSTSAFHGRRRIVGGDEAIPHSVPWIVSLQRSKGSLSDMHHFCSGTLIRVNSRHETDIVISAAHCFVNGTYFHIQVVAGIHDLNKAAFGEQRVNASKYEIHPDYNDNLTSNDVALLKLDKPIQFGPTAQPVCLPNYGEDGPPDGTPGLVLGWGSTQDPSGPFPSQLRQAVVPVYNTQLCAYNYRNFYNTSDPNDSSVYIDPDVMLCAGTGKMDSCRGDSGGPLVFRTSRGFVLHGIISFGPRGCAEPRRPGVYTRVSAFVDWIIRTANVLTSLPV